MDWQDETLTIPPIGKKVSSVKLFTDQTALRYIENDLGVSVQIPAAKRQEIDTIIEITLK
jgi:hypothetical protein